MTISELQIKELQKLWFVYGNNGKKHTHCNHRYIQNFLEHNEDTKDFYLSASKNDLSIECINAVENIIYKHNKN